MPGNRPKAVNQISSQLAADKLLEKVSEHGGKQAEGNLILKLYEMRREEELRKAREWFDTEFNPQSAKDILDIVSGTFADSALFRMVMIYWEMVAGPVNYGALNADLDHLPNVEHLRYWAKIKPFIDEVRQMTGPGFLPELEKLVKTASDYKKRLAGWRKLNQNWAQ